MKPDLRDCLPEKSWQHYEIWKHTRKALKEVHRHFQSSIDISGINATEIFVFGQALSAAVEEEVVRVLNELRKIWDPQGEYQAYRFYRQPESFPDVLLRHEDNPGDIIFGIELKSWYLLAKERDPSYRFRVTPAACAKADLLAIFPWALSNVVSGTPVVWKPYLHCAYYLATLRNYWWQNIREAASDSTIEHPSDVSPYPAKRQKIADVPKEDQGKNFGRLARITKKPGGKGIMDWYIERLDNERLIGISVKEWRNFFKKTI